MSNRYCNCKLCQEGKNWECKVFLYHIEKYVDAPCPICGYDCFSNYCEWCGHDEREY